MELIQDNILAYLEDLFTVGITDQHQPWERVEHFAIDDASRMKRAAIGMVDQGEKYDFKVSFTRVYWTLAVEFFVRCDQDQDIQSEVNYAKRDIYRAILSDRRMGGLTVDASPLASDVFVDRAQNQGEGVMLFSIEYRTLLDDIGTQV